MTWIRRPAGVVGVLLVGALVGLGFGLITPTHVEVAGSDAQVQVKFGRVYDQLGIDQALIAKRPTERTWLGEPVGVQVHIDLDPSVLTSTDGSFDPDILPAYVQAYSDPEQLVVDGRHAFISHLGWFTGAGAAIALLVGGAVLAYRRWRRQFDEEHWPSLHDRALARQYWRPERDSLRRALVGGAVLVVIAAVPSATRQPPGPVRLHPAAILAGTPFADVEIDGLLRPALLAAKDYIETYFDQTNTYYDQLRDRLAAHLAQHPVTLPGAGADVVRFGLVSDRHCNIGMDRVVVELLQHFGVHTLVSAGDDAFSGSFGFETACTRNLASKTADAGISDVFVGGNHDSPMTIEAQADQGITTLTGDVVHVGGLAFAGTPDPRTSRYGQGIYPATGADQLLTQQGTEVGEQACTSDDPVIVVLHDPLAGRTALRRGCGTAVLALDGHTHTQDGPNPIQLPDGRTGYQLTSGTSGGAPGESAIERTFASSLTVGPLNHEAVITILTVDRTTAELVGVTAFRFEPDQSIRVATRIAP